MSRPLSRAEHPLTAFILHWLHLASFVVLACTGLAIHAMPEAARRGSEVLSLHMAAMPVFLISTILRVMWAFLGDGSASRGEDRLTSDWRHFLFHRGDWHVAQAWVRRYLGSKEPVPDGEKYNPLQKVVYVLLFPLGIVILTLTGLAMDPSFCETLAWVPKTLGGEGPLHLAHYISMWFMIVLTAAHVYAAIRDGGCRLMFMLVRLTRKDCLAVGLPDEDQREAA